VIKLFKDLGVSEKSSLVLINLCKVKEDTLRIYILDVFCSRLDNFFSFYANPEHEIELDSFTGSFSFRYSSSFLNSTNYLLLVNVLTALGNILVGFEQGLKKIIAIVEKKDSKGQPRGFLANLLVIFQNAALKSQPLASSPNIIKIQVSFFVWYKCLDWNLRRN
jgi:hypothetical protein